MEKEKQLVFLENNKGIVKTKDKIGHLYILSDEEIKENEFDKLLKQGLYFESSNGKIITNSRVKTIGIYKKIIATTDKSLIIKDSCNCFATTYEGCSECLEYLPHPSQSFINKFVEKWNSNTPIQYVNVDYELSTYDDWIQTGTPQPKHKLKVDKNNEITITPIKDSWNKQDVIELIKKFNSHTLQLQKLHLGNSFDVLDWCEQNL